MIRIFTLTLLFVCNICVAQQIVPFQLYTNKGRKVSVKHAFKKIAKHDVILFGELHNNPISHWLELELAKFLANEEKKLTLGAEMFEANQQDLLNDYLSGKITHKELDSLTKLWSNYSTDYKPIVDFAKENKIPFSATNIPRKFASLVYHQGFQALEDSLTEKQKEWVAPLPIKYDPNLPGYKAMLKMMGHNPNPNFPKAQAIKDATMAHFIYRDFKKYNSTFLHYNGDYHSKNHEGIFWYLKQLDSTLSIATISTVEQEDVKSFLKENKNRADFIIVVDKDMTKTY